ncbi:MAG: hypothetical protein HC788_15200 [Sphingopyxis sp.]|nr:hypothetical protein [Sphingopyxis sp.]
MALWIDREEGDEGDRFIAERVLHFDAEGNEGGKQLWMDVARRFAGLRQDLPGCPN